MNIFTIGFAQKSAEVFFKLLVDNNVKKLIDIRLNNNHNLQVLPMQSICHTF